MIGCCPKNNKDIMREYDNFSETFAKSRKNMHWPEIDYFMDFIKSSPNLNRAGLEILDV